jgi:hypothetical protein
MFHLALFPAIPGRAGVAIVSSGLNGRACAGHE